MQKINNSKGLPIELRRAYLAACAVGLECELHGGLTLGVSGVNFSPEDDTVDAMALVSAAQRHGFVSHIGFTRTRLRLVVRIVVAYADTRVQIGASRWYVRPLENDPTRAMRLAIVDAFADYYALEFPEA